MKPQSITPTPTPSAAMPVSTPSVTPAAPAVSPASGGPAASATLPISPRAAACITQGIRVKGEITGKEDLFVDGILEGKLDLGNSTCPKKIRKHLELAGIVQNDPKPLGQVNVRGSLAIKQIMISNECDAKDGHR